jgi:hypothetical protein
VELRESTFDTGEIAINYGEGAPTGPPIILLHGMTGWWPDLEGVIEVLEPEWHV